MSVAPVSIEISDVHDGWASVRVRAGEQSYRIDGLAHFTDAFDGIARLGVSVVLNAPGQEVVIDADDGRSSGWLWSYQRVGEQSWFVVYELADFTATHGARTQVFKSEIEADQFAGAILVALKGLQDSGMDALEQAWNEPFPLRAVAALETALATPKPRDPRVGSAPLRFTISAETPLQDDVGALVNALNEYTFALTPAEYRHHMTVEQMAQPDLTLFVARLNGAMVGMGALRRHTEGVGEVKRMFVTPEARGHHVAANILHRIEALARQQGCTRLVLETGSNFDAAKRVYEREGFSPCDPILDYPPSPWTAFYAKSLAA